MSNVLKTPPITSKTKILSFDLEANGLHGEAFAVAGVVMDKSGKVYDQFIGRTKIIGKVDEWVEQNVLPVIKDMPITHTSTKHLRDNFWAWFTKAKELSDYVLVSNGYPVEYRFLLQCQDDDIGQRYWDHPFPILDLTSILVSKDQDIQEAKAKATRKYKARLVGAPHNPLYDAELAAIMAFEVLN